MIPSISVQTLASVPSAAAAAMAEVADDAAEEAAEAAEEAAEDADDTVDEVEPPQAVKPSATAAVAHDASTTFERSTTVHSFPGTLHRIVGRTPVIRTGS